jgi:hypothetical protein
MDSLEKKNKNKERGKKKCSFLRLMSPQVLKMDSPNEILKK